MGAGSLSSLNSPPVFVRQRGPLFVVDEERRYVWLRLLVAASKAGRQLVRGHQQPMHDRR